MALFRSLLNEHRIDVFGLSETWLIESDVVAFPDYVIYRQCQETRKRGLALGVHRSLSNNLRTVAVPAIGEIELLACSIDLGNETANLATFYIPPANEYALTRTACIKLFTCIPQPSIFTGDLNGHHQVWGCADTDARGRLVMDVIEELGLTIVNDGSITRIARPPLRPSAIDLTFSSPSLSLSLNWRVLEDRGGSDHYPTVSTLSYNHNAIRRLPRRRQHDLTKNIDWGCFADEVALKIPEISALSFEQKFEAFRDTLVEAAETAQTKSLPSDEQAWQYSTTSPWWDEEVGVAHRSLIQAERFFKRSGTQDAFDQVMEKQREFQRLRHTKKQESWRSRCEEFDEHTPLSELFGAARRYRNRAAASEPTMTDETLHLFAKRLAPDSTFCPPTFEQSRDDPIGELSDEFTMDEFETVLASANDSAPGVDRIKYSMLTHLTHESKQFLLDLYNEAYRESKVPAWWKVAKVVAIKKPGKDAREPSAWRPISLLSVVRKVFEKLQLLRLEFWAERNQILSDHQWAFRKGRSTMDCLTLLLNHIYSAFERKQVVVAVFLDIEGAFDNVDINILCEKLMWLGVSRKSLKMIWELMSERRLLFESASGEVFERVGYKGLPQGASNSPFMYAAYTQDLCEVLGPEVEIIEFADDVAILTRHKDEEMATRSMQVALDSVWQWFRRHGLTLSCTKTVAQMFSRRHTLYLPELTVQSPTSSDRIDIWNKEPSVTYLGRKFDRKLLMNVDVAYSVKRCEQRINFMRSITGTWWGAHPSSLLTLFNSCIRPVLEYGTIVRLRLKKNQLLKLQRVQWKAIRIAGGFMMTTPCCAMEVLLGVMPLELRFQQLVTQYLLKVVSLQRSNILSGFFELLRLRPEHPHLREFTRVIALDPPLLPPGYPFTVPYESLIHHPTVDNRMYEGYHRLPIGSRPARAVTLFDNLFPLEEHFLHLFTDGSSIDGATGLGIWGTFEHEEHHRLPSPASVFTAEIRAIFECAKWISNNGSTGQAFQINTDSYSGIQALQNRRMTVHSHPAVVECKRVLQELADAGVSVKLSWVPAHVGIQGNETADRLAGEGALMDEPTLQQMSGHREYYPVFKRWIQIDWQTIWEKEKRGRHTFSITPTVKKKPWFKGLNLTRHQVVFINRCMTNHTRTNSHLSRFGIVDSPLCECGTGYATVEHYIKNCPNIDHQQQPQHLNSKPLRDLAALGCWEELSQLADYCRLHKIPI